jgi:hypothetical protein
VLIKLTSHHLNPYSSQVSSDRITLRFEIDSLTFVTVACFFVQPRIAGRQPDDNYYRAVYLLERTVKALVSAIAMKINVEPTKVTRTIRINQKGLQILMDDEAVDIISEQQDMTAEFHEIGTPPVHPMKREWDSGPTDIQVDGDINVIENVNSTGYELRLLF